MPTKRKGQTVRGAFSFSSDSDDDLIELHLSRYQEASFGAALNSRANYARAVEELTAIVRQAYVQYANKLVQDLIFEDILRAIRFCNRLEQHRKALAALIEASKQRLPQVKSRRIQQEYKKRLVLLSRRHSQPGAEQTGDDVDDLLGDVPLEVVHHMFGFLDPLTLGKASCVCLAWQQLVRKDEALWRRCFYQVTDKNATIAVSSQKALLQGLTHHQLFISTVTKLPRLLDPFRSNRIFCGRQLAWKDPNDSARPAGGAQTCPSVQMVVSYMLGLPVNLTQEIPLPESDSDEEELSSRINRLWRPSLTPMVKSYSHSSM